MNASLPIKTPRMRLLDELESISSRSARSITEISATAGMCETHLQLLAKHSYWFAFKTHLSIFDASYTSMYNSNATFVQRIGNV